jgi:hypothetical protein
MSAGAFFFLDLAVDELDDVRVIGVGDDHLAARRVFLPDLITPANASQPFMVAPGPTPCAAGQQLLRRRIGEVRASAGSELNSIPSSGRRQMESIVCGPS